MPHSPSLAANLEGMLRFTDEETEEEPLDDLPRMGTGLSETKPRVTMALWGGLPLRRKCIVTMEPAGPLMRLASSL